MFDKGEKQIKKIDKALEQIETQIHDNIFEIGRLFYKTNKGNDGYDSIYQKGMDAILQLETDQKKMYGERLKLQGLMQCEHCNSIIPYGSTFCNNCGQKQENGTQSDEREEES